MKLLVIGSGAREHTITWKLKQSPKADEVFVAPGNAGTAAIAHNVAISATDIPALIAFAKQNRIDFTFVGPEQPLAEGVVDAFQAEGLAVFGPSKAAARIEASKVFSKDLMQRYGIPCAKSKSFSSYEQASDYVKQQAPPIVLKADGLAAGKGVIIAQTQDEAQQALTTIMKDKAFGAAGNQVVVEEYLTGREMSYFVFSDGRTVQPLVPACDYKRVYDGNQGPNTGGMGSYSPPEFYTPALGAEVLATVMQPTIRALAQEGCPYTGVLYGGLMITRDGPRVIEFNARLGDPETQVVLPRLETDLVDIVLAVRGGELAHQRISWSSQPCVGVVLASGGYPGPYQTGFPISGLQDVDKDVMVFHAGTKPGPKGEVLTAGGRVLTVVASGKTMTLAREKVYNNISRIHFEGAQYRKDIALLK